MGFCVDVDVGMNGGRGKVRYVVETRDRDHLDGVDGMVGWPG